MIQPDREWSGLFAAIERPLLASVNEYANLHLSQ